MYTCQYCGRTLTVTETYAEVCQCPEALKEELSLKERSRQLGRQRQQTIAEARKQNKRPIRGK